MEDDLDLDALLEAVGVERRAEEAPETSEFGQRLAVAMADAIRHLRERELVDVPEEKVDDVVAQVTAAGLEARSPKQLMKRVVRALMDSDDVEEVYGSDEVLFGALRGFLEG